MFHKCSLHWMKIAWLTDSLDCRDLIPLVHGSKSQARIDPPAIYMHCASAALAVVAALLSARQMQGLPQTIQQRHAWINLHRIFFSIDSQRDSNAPRHLGWCLCMRILPEFSLCETDQRTGGCRSAETGQKRATAQVCERSVFLRFVLS